MKSSLIVAGVIAPFSAAPAYDDTTAASATANRPAVNLDFMTPPPSKRPFDLPHLGAPRNPFSLQQLHDREKQQREQRENEQNDESESGVQTVVRLQHEVAESFVRRDELGDDRAGDGEHERDFDAREEVRQRIRQADFLKHVPCRAAVDARELDQLRLDLFQAYDGVDDDWEECDEKRDRDLGKQSVADPDDHQGREGAFGHRIQNYDERINGIVKVARIHHGDGKDDAENERK